MKYKLKNMEQLCNSFVLQCWGCTSLCQLQLKIRDYSWWCSVQIKYPLKNALLYCSIVNSFYLFCNLPCTFKKYLLMQKSIIHYFCTATWNTTCPLVACYSHWSSLHLLAWVKGAELGTLLTYTGFLIEATSWSRRKNKNNYFSKNLEGCLIGQINNNAVVGILVDNCTQLHLCSWVGLVYNSVVQVTQ